MVSPSAQVVGVFPRCIWKSSNGPGPAGGVRQIDEIIKTNPDRQLSHCGEGLPIPRGLAGLGGVGIPIPNSGLTDLCSSWYRV